MRRRIYVGMAIVMTVVLLVGIAVALRIDQSQSRITSFEACAAAGNPIQEIFPEVCVTKGGQRFVKPIGSYHECVSAGNPVMLSNPPQCHADGQTFTETQ